MAVVCMAGRAVCLAGGHAWWGACVAGGACVAVGACLAGGCVWWGGVMCGGRCAWWRACMAGEMATAVGGTHPTGMHSC